MKFGTGFLSRVWNFIDARREIEQALNVGTMQGPGRFTLYTAHRGLGESRQWKRGTYDWAKWRAHRDAGMHEKPDLRTCRECGKEVKGEVGLADHIKHKHGDLEQAA